MFKCRRWREPHTEALVQGEDLSDWNAPDHYVFENVNVTSAGEVVFVEVEQPDGSWKLWRCASIDNPLELIAGRELAFALFTGEVSEAAAEAEMLKMGVKPPQKGGSAS